VLFSYRMCIVDTGLIVKTYSLIKEVHLLQDTSMSLTFHYIYTTIVIFRVNTCQFRDSILASNYFTVNMLRW